MKRGLEDAKQEGVKVSSGTSRHKKHRSLAFLNLGTAGHAVCSVSARLGSLSFAREAMKCVLSA